MAGSINLSLSQQFDKLNGTLLSGGRLYFYAAGTDDPQNAYKDTNLTLVHPNPVILASDGRIPQLYFADGSVHVRLTDSAGVVQFDEDFILVVGPSDGGGGGGGSTVDPNAIFQTGMMDWQPISGNRSGWVILDGSTLGSSSSGATYALSDAAGMALYEYNWATYADSICPVLGGRTNAHDDWTSNKRMTLLDFREIIMGGLSDMGHGDRGGFSALPTPERGSRTTAASILGEITHALTIAELATHVHGGSTATQSVGHTHGYSQPAPSATSGTAGGLSAGGGSGNIWYGGSVQDAATNAEVTTHVHGFATDPAGSGAAHNNTPRTMLGTFYQKL